MKIKLNPDAGNAIELVFRHSVGIFFEYFIAL